MPDDRSLHAKPLLGTLFAVIGWGLVIAGLLCNVWVLGKLYAPTGTIATPLFRYVIWVFDLLCIAGGLLIRSKAGINVLLNNLRSVLMVLFLGPRSC